MGVRLYLCFNVARLALRRLRGRCICPAYRWLAGEQQHANRLRSGCPGASAARSTAEPYGRPDTPGSTPLTRTVLKEPKTSDLAEQLYDAFVGYETAQYSRTDPLALHQVSGTIDEQHARA